VAPVVGVLAAAALAVPYPAAANVTSEVQRGQQLAIAVRSGQQPCSALSADDFELVGEYAMDRFIGNRAAHEAMNQHMVQMMGSAGERRMHIALGYRYIGCPGAPPSSWLGPMAGMMGNYGGGSGPGPGMMGPRRGGPGGSYGPMMRAGSHGDRDLSGPAIAALGFVAAVLGGLLVAFALYLRGRRPGTAVGQARGRADCGNDRSMGNAHD
jgi:hypothetical protein